MTSAYTYILHKQDVSFPDFARNCARAMVVASHQMDEPLSEPVRAPEVSPYAYERLREAERHLQDILSLTDASIRSRMLEEYEDEVRAHNARCHEISEIRARYDAMLVSVNAWTPPTPDHESLKEFMLNQLADAIAFDCRPKKAPEKPDTTIEGVAAYKAELVKDAEDDVEYTKTRLQREIKRVQSAREYIAALEASLAEYETHGTTP